MDLPGVSLSEEEIDRYAGEDEDHSDDGLTRAGDEGVYHQAGTEDDI